jgi:nucleoside-diphosphate-sugar epimerase
LEKQILATYIVTGAAGFIASKVSEQLIQSGHIVLGVDTLNDAYDVRLKEWRLRGLRELRGFEFTQCDINDRTTMRSLFERKPAGVFNLAARAGVRQSVENPWVYVETNMTGTVTLLELCREFSVTKFLLASTSSLYGAHNPRPFKEDADTNKPLSPYAASKKGAEALCYTYHHLYGINVAIPRYFTVYGPGGRPDMSLFRFVQWIAEERPVTVYGDGLQSRDFTFVDDIASGTIACLSQSGYNIVNLGSDGPVVLLDAIRLIEDLVGKKARLVYRPMHAADVTATWADITKARTKLGWEPTTGFESGVRALVNWYMTERAWAKKIITE